MTDKPPEYFEGILQLRNPTDALVRAVHDEVEKKGDVAIAKIKKVKGGLDFYISSQRFLRPLGQKLQKQFGGHLEVSTKLFSRNRLKSRDVYRVNVLLRLHDFKKGDLIEYKGMQLKITGVQKKISAKDPDTGKKYTIDFKEVIL